MRPPAGALDGADGVREVVGAYPVDAQLREAVQYGTEPHGERPDVIAHAWASGLGGGAGS
ncbi:hypothetical protein AB0N21_40300 [Streptomyces sp. NPDC051080]|uniref:hypothetical protein n=1 Tax=Streptomyces sp. NPDC051080 TaxID=3157222 RepID=UPI003427A111